MAIAQLLSHLGLSGLNLKPQVQWTLQNMIMLLKATFLNLLLIFVEKLQDKCFKNSSSYK